MYFWFGNIAKTGIHFPGHSGLIMQALYNNKWILFEVKGFISYSTCLPGKCRKYYPLC